MHLLQAPPVPGGSLSLKILDDTRRVSRRRRAKAKPARKGTDSQADPSPSDAFKITIIRSKRRKKTVSARMLNWYTIEVRAPADIPEEELQSIIQRYVARALQARSKRRNFGSDDDLERRAARLNKTCFDNELRWRSIRFVSNQNSCFGSCSPTRGTIRISHRLVGAPSFVLDYVIVHELAHLLEPNHSKAFWELVYRYSRTERARGYLMAMQLENDIVDSEPVGDKGIGEL